jgi:hypothetical protein
MSPRNEFRSFGCGGDETRASRLLSAAARTTAVCLTAMGLTLASMAQTPTPDQAPAAGAGQGAGQSQGQGRRGQGGGQSGRMLPPGPPIIQAGPNCENVPNSDHPKAELNNGAVKAVLFLPDKDNGYYRAARFDWAGVIGCVSYKQHTYFGVWYPRYDPMINDSIVGPVEEFRHSTSEIGYDDAAANGGRFIKIGVGVLKTIDDKPYQFGKPFPIVDYGTRKNKVSQRSVTMTQEIKTDFGYGYKYEKTVELDKKGGGLTLRHKLKNTGTKPLETDVYDHDFYMLDNKPTDAGMTVKLGFAPTPDKPFPSTATIDGKMITFNSAPSGRTNPAPQGYLTGYTGAPGEYSIEFDNPADKIGVVQTSKSPLSKFYFWSTNKTVCPEGYIRIKVGPGETQEWEIHYAFKAE